MRDNQLRLYIIAVSIFLFLGITGGLLNVAWTYMRITFDVEVSDIGVLLLAATTGSLIAAFSSGSAITRLGIGRVILMGTLFSTFGLASIALTRSWLMLLPLTFLMYIGRGTLDAGLNNFVSAHYGSTAMNWLHASWGAGLTIAPAIITSFIVTMNLGWQPAYAIMSGLSLFLVAAVLLNLPQWKQIHTPEPEIERSPNETIHVRTQETLRLSVVRWCILLFFVYGGVEVGTGQLLNTLLVEGRDVTQEVASLWLSFYWGSFTIGRFLIGFVALRFSDQTILSTSTMLAVIGSVFVIPSQLIVLNAVGLILIGFGLAGLFPILISQTPRRVGHKHTANTIGFQVGVASFGAAILPGLIGLTTDFLGLEAIAWGILFSTSLLAVLNHRVAVRFPVPLPKAQSAS